MCDHSDEKYKGKRLYTVDEALLEDFIVNTYHPSNKKMPVGLKYACSMGDKESYTRIKLELETSGVYKNKKENGGYSLQLKFDRNTRRLFDRMKRHLVRDIKNAGSVPMEWQWPYMKEQDLEDAFHPIYKSDPKFGDTTFIKLDGWKDRVYCNLHDNDVEELIGKRGIATAILILKWVHLSGGSGPSYEPKGKKIYLELAISDLLIE